MGFSLPDTQDDQYSSINSYGVMPKVNYGLGSAPNYQQSMGNGMGLQAPVAPWQTALAPATEANDGWFTGVNSWMKNNGILDSIDPKTGLKTQGIGGLALGTASGLMSAYMGMKQYGLAKQTLAHNKDQFNKNYAAQKQTTNASLEDRQRARVASNDNAYVSVGDYMKKNGIV